MSVFVCTLAFARAVRAAGLGQVRPLPIALGRAPDFGSGQVQFDVVIDLETFAHICMVRAFWTPRNLGWPNAGPSRHSLLVFVGCAPVNNIPSGTARMCERLESMT